MVDYSKWNNIELSDDDGEDCHPNIEKNTWIRLKREQRERAKQEAQEKFNKELAEKEEAKKKAAELEAQLSSPSSAESAEKLRLEIEKLRAKEQAIAKKHAEEEEKKKKYVKWDKDTICHEGFSKTIINKPAAAAAAAPAPAPAPAPIKPAEVPAPPPEAVPAAATVLPPPKKQDMTEEELDAYVRDMEIKAHKFANARDYDEYYEILRQNPELLTKETNEYLLLHVSDFIKKGQYDRSKKYVIGACIIQYSVELGPQGAQMFFHRIRDTNGKKNYRKEFERETMEYWEKVKVKILELQAERARRKAAGLSEDPAGEGEGEEVDGGGDGGDEADNEDDFQDAVQETTE